MPRPAYRRAIETGWLAYSSVHYTVFCENSCEKSQYPEVLVSHKKNDSMDMLCCNAQSHGMQRRRREGAQVAASLLLRYSSLSSAPLHVLYSQWGTLTRAWPSSCRCRRFSRVEPIGAPLARKCEDPSYSTHQPPPPLLLSPPVPGALSCTRISMEYPDFGQRTSSSTDSPRLRRVSLTCCCVVDAAVSDR
jgi:hypothetical protein